MDKKLVTKDADRKDLKRGKTCQQKREPGKSGNRGFQEILAYKTGEKGADPAEDKPVKKEKGNDELISLKLRKELPDGQQLRNHGGNPRGNNHSDNCLLIFLHQ